MFHFKGLFKHLVILMVFEFCSLFGLTQSSHHAVWLPEQGLKLWETAAQVGDHGFVLSQPVGMEQNINHRMVRVDSDFNVLAVTQSINVENTESPATLIGLTDGGYIYCRQGADPFSQNHWTVQRIDIDNNVVWNYSYFIENTNSSFYNIRSGFEAEDGSICLFGMSLDYGMTIIKITADGEVVWNFHSAEVNINFSDDIIGGLELANGNIAVFTQNSLYDHYSGFILSVVSTDGLPVFSKSWEIPDGGLEYALDLIELENGDLLMAGYHRRYWNHHLPFIAKISAIGEMIWMKEYASLEFGAGNQKGNFSNLRPLEDGSIEVLGSIQNSPTPSNGIKIIIDDEGNIISALRSQIATFSSTIKKADEHFIISQISDQAFLDSKLIIGDYNHGIVSLFSATDEYDICGDSYVEFPFQMTDVTEIEEFILNTSSTNISAQFYEPHEMVSVDLMNSMNACKSLTLNINEAVLEQPSISPNPASEIIQINLLNSAIRNGFFQITLYDVVGNTILKKTLPPQSMHTVDISDVPAGMYLLKINSKSGDVFSEKIFKE